MKDWKQIVGAFAPTVARALGGPLAGAAVTALSQKLLGREVSSEQQIAEVVVAGNPETLLKLKELEQEFEKHMAELGVQLEKLDQEDRSSAREREKVLRDHTPTVLALSVTVGFFGLLTALLIVKPPAESKEVLFIMLGAL